MDTSWPGFTSSLHQVSVEVEEFCDKGKSLTFDFGIAYPNADRQCILERSGGDVGSLAPL
jgi:hypothetical protein